MKDSRTHLTGLITAAHTPFHPDGSLNLEMVEKQAEHFTKNGVHAVFIGGTTGESHSLTLEERLALGRRWLEVVQGTKMKVIVHVGSNCLMDARTLAADAQKHGAVAISSLAPSYFKPRDMDALIASMADIAGAASETPFYYYDIPSMTGVTLPVAEFLARAPAMIPNLAGVKFTNPDMMAYQLCLHADHGSFDVPWGLDEQLLAALALGALGAVGSSYNFAAPIYLRLISAFKEGKLEVARMEQFRSVELIRVLAAYGYMAAAKAVMTMLGVDVGPPRLPHHHLVTNQIKTLRKQLEALGFFGWIA